MIRNKLEVSPNPLITEEIIKSKAIGLSSAIESAIGYWQGHPQAVNAKVLSRYYFLLQMTIAEQVSSVKNTDDLKEVQRHTERGHGLGIIINPENEFPENYFTCAIKDGHFYSYTKFLGLDNEKYEFKSRPKKFSEVSDHSKIVSLIDLFRRIPELMNVIEEYTDKPSLCFHVGHASINVQNDLKGIERYMKETGKITYKAPSGNGEAKTFISFYTDSKKVTPEYLSSLCLPFQDFKVMEGLSKDEEHNTGTLIHSSYKNWYDVLNTYTSSHSPTSLVVPLWNVTSDNIVINFTLLYTLSIIVRYLPDLWYRTNSGDLVQNPVKLTTPIRFKLTT